MAGRPVEKLRWVLVGFLDSFVVTGFLFRFSWKVCLRNSESRGGCSRYLLFLGMRLFWATMSTELGSMLQKKTGYEYIHTLAFLGISAWAVIFFAVFMDLIILTCSYST
jgi:hypothetical protein